MCTVNRYQYTVKPVFLPSFETLFYLQNLYAIRHVTTATDNTFKCSKITAISRITAAVAAAAIPKHDGRPDYTPE